LSITLPFDSDAAIAHKWKSPGFALSYRNRRARQFATPVRGVRRGETIADPEDVSSFERWRQKRIQDYFRSREVPPRDGRDSLPVLPEDTAETLAKRYGAPAERLAQALELENRGLRGKARRLVLCGRIGHRINHQKSPLACDLKFFELYFCREKYCKFCGPQQFREQFAKLQAALPAIVEKLLCDAAQKGRATVIAKLDFTVPNPGQMPTSDGVREFHRKMREFWRLAERLIGLGRDEYGVVRCDEIGGSNTNLHAHCGYVGPWLPQKRKELSALWSVAWIADRKRKKDLLHAARKYGLGSLWNLLAPWEQRFVSIKRAKSLSQALAHALQYPLKFIEKSSPDRLAALEKTFHKARRVSTGGAFYRIKLVREPGDDTKLEHQFCPYCKVRLQAVHEQWQPLSALEQEQRINLRLAHREARRNAVFTTGASP
jgi:hypothetical protein